MVVGLVPIIYLQMYISLSDWRLHRLTQQASSTVHPAVS